MSNFVLLDGRTNTSRICAQDTPDAKYASLTYKTVEKGHEFFSPQQDRADSSQPRAELDICLDTGRHHQIMQITDVRVRKVVKEGKLKAVVSITLDGEFVVSSYFPKMML